VHIELTIVQRRLCFPFIIRVVDQKCVVFVDLSAAFDTVNRDVLLSVLEPPFAVGGSALPWFRSYLDRRTQVFVVNGRQSAALPVSCSVHVGVDDVPSAGLHSGGYTVMCIS
jgi:hypothetical protein